MIHFSIKLNEQSKQVETVFDSSDEKELPDFFQVTIEGTALYEGRFSHVTGTWIQNDTRDYIHGQRETMHSTHRTFEFFRTIPPELTVQVEKFLNDSYPIVT